MRGNRVQVVGTLVLCNLAVTAVTVVLYLIAVVIVAVFAVWFADRRLELILVLEARDRIEMVLNAAHEHRADVGQLWRIDGVICAAGPETSEQRALEV